MARLVRDGEPDLRGDVTGWRDLDALAGAASIAAGAVRGLSLLQRADARDDRLRHSSCRTRASANILVALEALVGLLGFAILSGLLFARFTRPTAKISFSRNALIAPYRGRLGADVPPRQPSPATTSPTCTPSSRSRAGSSTRSGARRRRFDQLALERDAISMMPLHWVIVHPIGPNSPLRGFAEESLAPANRKSSA